MERIAKYELREVLGQGGMGVVYRAYDPVIDREVALKIILESALDLPDVKSRFIREARMAGRLSHENIAVIYDLGEFEGKTFIAMEYLPGRDLRSIIDHREPLSLRDRIEFARQICSGLQYAHAQGIIHRDIKPENIKVLPDKRVKILDFGIAKPYVQASTSAPVGMEAALTGAGMRIGTPWYMSPEQVKGLPVDRRSDIFSFGVLLHELLTYSKPFRGDDTTVLYKIVHEEPEPLLLPETSLSGELYHVVKTCLAKDPAERYEDCQALLRDLTAIADGPARKPAIDHLLEEGHDLERRHRLEDAKRKYNDVLDIDPHNEQASGSLHRIVEQQQESSLKRILPGNIIGETVSHFKILERIGGGGMGVVYKAEDLALKRTVALKFLLSEKALNTQAEKRFLKEAQAASSLDHPNICTIHEIGETAGGLLFICMAYYPGEDLGALLKSRQLDISEALDIGIRVARGLGKAHEHGIIHRDVKPANIIVTRDGEVKVVDFGLAKLMGGTQLTRLDAAMGTMMYMSPEQVRGNELDHRTDIWSFGVMLYQALTGRLPFEGTYEAALSYAIVNENPPAPSTLRPGLPREMDRIVARALEKRPQDRYSSMQEITLDLEAVRQELAGTSNPEARSATSVVETGRRHLQRKEYAEALVQFEAALARDPGNAEILELYSQCARQLAGTRQADTLAHEAGSLLEKRRFREARDVLLRATTIDPGNPLATQLLGKTEEILERQESVEKLLLEANFYERHEKFSEAVDRYQKILDIDSTHRDALRGLRRISKARQAKTDREITFTGAHRTRDRARWALIAGLGVLLVSAGLFIWSLLAGRTDQVLSHANGIISVDSSTIVASAREEMLAQQNEAEKAESGTYATALYNAGRQAGAQGEQELARGHYALAQRLFIGARSIFATAASEATRASSAAASSLGTLRDLVGLVRREMEVQKETVGKTGVPKEVLGLYRTALSEERRGDKLMQGRTKADLLAAHSAFTNARETYRRAVDEATTIVPLKREAERQRAAMQTARQNINGSEAARQAAPSYQKALQAESEGQRLFQSSDFSGARDAFTQAGKLYAETGKELVTPPQRPETPPLADNTTAKQPLEEKTKPQPVQGSSAPAAEVDANAAARQSINQMLQTYKESIERGDVKSLGSLLRLSEEKQRFWTVFFSASQNRAVAIDNVDIGIDKNSAQVTFNATISFLNTATNTPQTDEHPRAWTLESDGGTWRVVTQK